MAGPKISTVAFLARQLGGLRDEWQARGTFLAGIQSTEALANRLPGKSTWKALGSIGERNAVVVGPATTSPELWVRPDYGSYGSAFALFAATYYGYDYDGAPDKPGFDVDPLFSHTRAGPAQLSLALVRVALVPRAANRSWGSFVEKALVTTDAQHAGKTHHHSTAFLLAKFVGLLAPAKDSYGRDIGQIADRLVQLNFEKASNRDLLIFGMTYLYEQEVLGIEPKKKSFP